MTVRTFVAAALLVPAVALAAPAKSSRPAAQPAEQSSASGLEVGGFIGYESADVSGLSLRLDGEVPYQALSPQVKLSWLGSLGYSHLTEGSFAGGSFTANVVKVIPSARFTFPVAPQFSLSADAGLGLAFVFAKIDFPGIPGLIPGFSESHSSVNLMMRFAGAAWFAVNPKVRLGVMLEFDPIFGDFGFSGASSQDTWLIQGGAMFAL